jgi:hypothetical protein
MSKLKLTLYLAGLIGLCLCSLPLPETPLLIQSDVNMHNEYVPTLDSPNSADIINPVDIPLDPGIVAQSNVSQFNVTDQITSLAPQTSLNISNQQLTRQYPTDWDFQQHQLNISAVYKPTEVITDGGVSQSKSFTVNTNPSYYLGAPFYMVGSTTNGYLSTGPRKDPLAIAPTMDTRSYGMFNQTVVKPDSDLNVQETDLVRSGSTIFPIDAEFNSNPNWTALLENPFGGTSGTSTRRLQWNPGVLECYIKAGKSQISLGNPSIAWQTNFSIPNMVPNRVLLTVRWSVENLGYEMPDNFMVMGRIDGIFINGTVDAFGNTYFNNATGVSIEYDGYFPQETVSHAFITRVFDVTSLIDPYLAVHTLELGIWLSNIDDTSDEVRVLFDYVQIQATEPDQYRVARLGFSSLITAVSNNPMPTASDLANWVVVAKLQSPSGANDVYVLGNLIDFLSGSFIFDVTSRSKNILNQSSFDVSIGIYLRQAKTFTIPYDVRFDNILLLVNYAQTNLTKLQLQYSTGSVYMLTNSWIITTTTPTSSGLLTMSFQVAGNYTGSIMIFQSILIISKGNVRNATADYYITSFDSSLLNRINWKVAYNNSASINRSWAFTNFRFTGYRFTIEDLPALDGAGPLSTDWDLDTVQNPEGGLFTPSAYFRTFGSQFNPNTQNLTVIYTNAEIRESITNGTWVANLNSPNYLTQVQLLAEGTPTVKIYHGDNLQIHANRSDIAYAASISGNYSISIFNSSNSLHTDFPRFFSNVAMNQTDDWTAIDDGVGKYSLLSVWNDTQSDTGQTVRVGIRIYSFEMWRKTQAELIIVPDPLNSGEKGLFYFNYSQIFGDLPISGAASFITLYNNKTVDPDLIWGYDWPPYVSLVESVRENLSAPGHYNLTFRTGGVPPDTYSVYLALSKPFFDPVYLDSIIQITGEALQISIAYGATNYSGQVFMDESNIPFVNDTAGSWIVVYVSNNLNQPVTGGSISGRFNGTSTIFYGYDIYTQTLNDADKGYYNITLNTMGLNATTPYRLDFANYSLSITVTIVGYSPASVSISTPIKPLPTQITASNTPNLYEAGTFEFFATFQNILNPSNPLPLNFGTLQWALLNDTGIVATGAFTFILSGVYRAIVSLSTESYYIAPGVYNFTINGSQTNCFIAQWLQSGLVVYSKSATQITLAVTQNVRIGQSLDVVANLKYANNTPIANANVEIALTYKETDSFSIIKTTDEQGQVSYSQIVSYIYADTDVTINVTYAGNPTTEGCTAGVFRDIKGLLNVNLTLEAINEIRVGYNSTLIGNIIIEETVSYTGIFLTLAAWYDGEKTSPIFITEIRAEDDGTFNYTIPVIQSGYKNITFFIDYSGSATIAYKSTNFTVDISPKWDVNISITEISGELRIGYTREFHINATFINVTCPESFFGLSLYIQFMFASGTSTIYETFFDSFGGAILSYTIPQTAGSWMNMSIVFLGNTRIASFVSLSNYSIAPKWSINLTLNGLSNEIYHGQTVDLSVQGFFIESNCPESLVGLPITITLNFGEEHGIVTLEGTLSSDGILLKSYTIPVNPVGMLEITISCSGSQIIFATTISHNITLLDQITTRIVVISPGFYQDFAGTYSFSVKLQDIHGYPVENQRVYFVVRDITNHIVGNYSAISNAEGIATALISFDAIGEYRIDVFYPSTGIYKGITLSGDGDVMNVRIVNYGMLFIDYLPQILLGLALAIASGFVFHRTVIRPRQIRQRNELMEIHRRFADVENVQYLLIIHKENTVPLFSHAFTEMPIDETLVSGFLSAINSFGAEIGAKVTKETGTSAAERFANSGLEELAYKQFKIAVFEGQYVRTAILLLKTASPSLKTKMKEFNAEFEKQFPDVCIKFTGAVPDPEPIIELAERILNADLLYIHNVVLKKVPAYIKQTGKKSIKGLLLKEAQSPAFNGTFKVREIINAMVAYGKRDVDTFNAIYELRKDKIVFAINSRTQALIDQFKPLIVPLSEYAKKYLRLFQGEQIGEKEVKKQLGNVDPNSILTELRTAGLMSGDNLNETGVVIATLLGLFPDMF